MNSSTKYVLSSEEHMLISRNSKTSSKLGNKDNSILEYDFLGFVNKDKSISDLDFLGFSNKDNNISNLDFSGFCSTMSLSDTSILSSEVMEFSISNGPKVVTTPLFNMNVMDRELTPILAQMMTLSPDSDDHPDVQWLLNWLTQPERSEKEFIYLIGPLQENVYEIMTNFFMDYIDDPAGDIIYVFKIVAEALAVKCPVLDGDWGTIAWRTSLPLGEWKNKYYGPGSANLSTWIIHVVGDPDMCPETELRLHMMLLYRAFVKIDKGNREQALDSLMYAFSLLDRRTGTTEFDTISTDVIDLLMFFNQDDGDRYIYKYGFIVAERLKQYRKKSQEIMLPQPRELLCLIALLKYITYGALIKGGWFRDKQSFIEEASSGLCSLVKIFKPALLDPNLLRVTAECIMDMMEAVLIWTAKQTNRGTSQECFKDVNNLLKELCGTKDNTVVTTPVGVEIIGRFKERICKLRKLISKQFLKSSVISFIIYNEGY